MPTEKATVAGMSDRALGFEGAFLTGCGPVAPQHRAIFLARNPPGHQQPTGGNPTKPG